MQQNDRALVNGQVLVSPPRLPGLLLSSLPLSAVRRARYSPAQKWIGLWRDQPLTRVLSFYCTPLCL